jgi:hypothetical protein
MVCQNSVPDYHVDRDSLVLWLQAAGLGILGLVSLIGSLAAPRNRRWAGIAFLVSAPAVAFCLGFEDGYFGVPFRGFDGSQPSFPMAALFVFAFFTPLYAPLMMIGNRRHAVYAFLALTLGSGFLFALSPWGIVIVPRLVKFSVPLLVFGAFWSGGDRLGWPPLAVTQRRSLPKRLSFVLAMGVLVTIVVLSGTLAMSAMDSRPWDPDCGGRDLFTQPLNSKHAVFTAKVIRVGHVTKVAGRWAGKWAIGLVQERFWGLPPWRPHLVFITMHPFWEGETYLIDGNRDPRLLNRFLPIVEAGPCTLTRPVNDAGVELRLLREIPSSREVRIAGRVEDHLHPEPLALTKPQQPPDWNRMSSAEVEALQEQRRYPVVAYRRTERPLVGSRIRVSGSTGSTILMTDRNGFYEVAGLPVDDYKLELLDVAKTQYAVHGAVQKKELIDKKVLSKDLYLFWDGAIEGRIRGLAGGPAKLWLHIERADGVVDVDSSKNSLTDDNGNFRFTLLPPGRYNLRINEDGPRDESPYAPQYYPSSADRDGAHLIEVGEGQHIRNVDFVLRRLDKRSLRVRVGRPDGRPVAEAGVRIAYEHTDSYDEGGWYETDVDQNGMADITVFSGSHIRVWAEQPVDEGLRFPTLHYSAGLEVETDRLPHRLDLVIMTTKPPFRGSRE